MVENDRSLAKGRKSRILDSLRLRLGLYRLSTNLGAKVSLRVHSKSLQLKNTSTSVYRLDFRRPIESRVLCGLSYRTAANNQACCVLNDTF